MYEIDINQRDYASKWGVSDFYPESEAELRAALESGEDFDTGWFGCKKEINYARIAKSSTGISVSVCAHMDELYEEDDLIYDALWEVCESEKELSEEIIESIRDAALDSSLSDETTCEELLFPNAGYDAICSALDRLEAEAMQENHEMYMLLCAIVKDHLDYMDGQQQ